ncbi:unnamed protein product [Boreogadus saida]
MWEKPCCSKGNMDCGGFSKLGAQGEDMFGAHLIRSLKKNTNEDGTSYERDDDLDDDERDIFTYRHLTFTASCCCLCCCSGMFNGLDVVVPVSQSNQEISVSKQVCLRNSASTSSHSTPYETDTGSVKLSLHLRHRFRRQLCPLFSLSFQPVYMDQIYMDQMYLDQKYMDQMYIDQMLMDQISPAQMDQKPVHTFGGNVCMK